MVAQIRPAQPGDLAQIHAIFEYYVLNTVVSFLTLKPPFDYVESRYKAAIDRGFPYLVAVDTASDEVVGYAYASAFRGFMLGYGHSAEMTIFCHPEHQNKGVGGRLMKELLAALRQTTHISTEAGHEDESRSFKIKKLFAIMAVDETGPDKGLGLRDWYIKFGFEEVGRLKGVGDKKGRM